MKYLLNLHDRRSSARLRLLLATVVAGLVAGGGSPLLSIRILAQEAPEETQQGEINPVPDGGSAGETAAAAEDKDSEASKADSQSSNRRRRPDVAKSSDQFLSVFVPIVEQTRLATVEIKSGNKAVAIGAIVDTAGFVLTKQSELKNPLTCVLHDGTSLSATVFGVHPGTDLALLKLSGEGVGQLPVVQWSQATSLEIGSWLASVKGNDDPVVIGVVGVKERMIRPKSGFMGVNLGLNESKVIVTNVNNDTPAQRAGVLANDVIIAVNGDEVADITSLQQKVQSFTPGDEITLKILRNDKEIVLELVLGDAEDLNPMFERSNQQNTMGGNELSKRRQDFPLAVQHDGFLKPSDCGGPVVNIDGQVVGINIARQGRVSSLMLPTSVVLPVLNDLKSGQKAPALVNKDRIDEINRSLQGLRTTINLSPAGSESSKSELDKLHADEKTARNKLENARKNLDEALEARLRAEIALQTASEKSDNARKEIERLELELQQLVSGAK